MHPLRWLSAHDANFSALRRATRTAIVMPLLFAFGSLVLHDASFATFAAFGSFALLLLTDVTGSRSDRVLSLATVAVVGLLLVGLGSLAALPVLGAAQPFVGAVAMAIVGFVVLFCGVISSGLAAAGTALLLAFVLPVTTAGSIGDIPHRLAGWASAGAVAMLAVAFCWPAPVRDPIRGRLVTCCRLITVRLRGDSDPAAHRAAADAATSAYDELRSAFFTTPNRPTALTSGSRIAVRLVDELGWLTGILDASSGTPAGPARRDVLAVKTAAAAVLDTAAALLDPQRPPAEPDPLPALRDALTELDRTARELEQAATQELPVLTGCVDGLSVELIDSLEPTFRAQEIAAAVRSVGANAERAALAERRSWWQRLAGSDHDRHPGSGTVWRTARERAAAHLQLRSVWLHNSLRGAVGLALAVLVADLSGLQHAFWIVLGTLSVLRSNALSTGQTVARGLLGTAAGIVVGGLLVTLVGQHRPVLWVLLPICIVVAGLAPAAVSFAAGQAAFTVTLLILFNIIAPVGYRIGLLRIEDIAIGCAVSLLVGLLFWPRGAAAALSRALADAYRTGLVYLQDAVRFGIRRCGLTPEVTAAGAETVAVDSTAAAAAARRLDDAFREYLAERGGKRLPLAETTTLVTGVLVPRLAADAILRLWSHEPGTGCGDRAAAAVELGDRGRRLVRWFDEFGRSLVDRTVPPPAGERDAGADSRLIAAVRRDLADHDRMSTSAAVRAIWTGDHLDAVRRAEPGLRAAASRLPSAGSPPRTTASGTTVSTSG